MDTAGVLSRIIRQVSARRIRIKTFFSEFDSMRTGHCTASQFKRGLALCNFKLVTAADMTALCRRYFNVRPLPLCLVVPCTPR